MPSFDIKWMFWFLCAPVLLSAQNTVLFPYPENGKWGYINSAGRSVVAPEYESAGSFSGGLARVGKIVDKELFYGFINTSGQEVIPPKFLYVSDFYQGLASVQIRQKYAYLRPDGTLSSGELFDEIFPVTEGMSRFKKDGLYGFADQNAQIIVPASFTEAENFQNGLALVKIGGFYGFMDPSGSFAISPKYENAESFNGGFAPVQEKRVWYLINKNGEKMGERTFDRVHIFSDGLARVRKGNLYGYIDRSGEIVIPISFKEADDFSKGLAIVSSGNRLYGYINTRGEMIAPFSFTRATRFDGTFARVSQGGSHGFMNAEGKYNLTDKISAIGSFFNKRSRVKVGRYYGFFDETAKLRIKPGYLQAGEFRGVLAPVLSAVPGGYRAGYLDANGSEVFSWKILPKPIPSDKDMLYVISYPGVPFYKGSDPESLIIVQMEYGATAEKTFQRTATPLIGLGLEGLLYSVKYYARPGFVFSEAVSSFVPPRIGMGIYNYFQDKFGVISITGSPYAFNRNIFAAFFNGSVMNRVVQRATVQDTYFIPFMKLSEAFFLFSAAMGYPSSSFPQASGKLSNFTGRLDEAYFSGSYSNDKPIRFSIRAGKERIDVVQQGSQGIQLVHEYTKPANGSDPDPLEIVFGGMGVPMPVVETNEILPAIPGVEQAPITIIDQAPAEMPLSTNTAPDILPTATNEAAAY